MPGCLKNCLIDLGYACSGRIGEASVCETNCGDKIKAGN